MSRTARRPLTASILGAAALLTAGCGVTTPIQTAVLYAPGDGVRIEITELVRGENLMILTADQGAEGILLGALVNDSGEDVEIDLVVAGERLTVPVDANRSVLLGTEDPVEIASVPDAPGSVTQATLSTASHGAVTTAVPVLDGTLSNYEEHVP